jgi:hypothetical protein
MNIEQWRLISGYDKYEVSSHGRVRINTNCHIMKQAVDKDGYKIIGLTQDKKRKTHKVHRLVGFAFLDKKNEDIEIDHMDHNRSNNMLDNLRWSTGSINQRNRTIAKNNSSGTSGVTLVTGNKAGWCATWYDDNKRHSKFFSIKKYGDDEAKQFAINYRKERAQENGYLNI